MGAWGYEIFEDDTACDVRDDFEDYIEQGLSVSEATERILNEYNDSLEDEDEEVLVYLALASLQLEHKKLQPNIKEITLDIIESGKGLEVWEDTGEDALKQRKKVLNELRLKLMK